MKKFIKKIFYFFGYTLKPVPRKTLFHLGQAFKKVQIGNYEILASADHTIDYNIKHYPFYNLNFPRIVKYCNENGRKGGVIDVGANIGDTVAFVKSYIDIDFICIEGDLFFYNLLQINSQKFKGLTLFNIFLSDKNSIEKFTLSYDSGSAALSKGESEAFQLSTLDTLYNKNIQLFSGFDFLKIDTDGFDLKVLRGSKEFMNSKRPILFFEYDREAIESQSENGLDIFKYLNDLGYYRVIYYDCFGRFIVSFLLNQQDNIMQMYNYINDYLAPFRFYDLCVFHETDKRIAEGFIKSEMALLG